jgi:hypothetical protein
LAEPPDERTFPAWRRVVPQSHRGQPGTLTFCFDSKLLTRIVAALGGDGRVELTVLLDAKRPGFSDGSPIEVRTVNGDPCEIGALMPSCS